MADFYSFAGDHPVLTFLLAVTVAGLVGRRIKYLSGSNDVYVQCARGHSCAECEKEDED